VLVVSALWSTTPTPEPAQREFPGPLPCVASEVLMGALALHPDHGPEPGASVVEEGAAHALVAATRCRELGTLPSEHTLALFRLTQHGLSWIQEHEMPAERYEQSLEVWKLAHDLQRSGGYLQVAVWQSLAGLAGENLEGVTPNPAESSYVSLWQLTESPLDWDAIRAREEAQIWTLVRASMGDPRGLRYLPGFLQALLDVRFDRGSFVAERQHDERLEHGRAALHIARLHPFANPRFDDTTTSCESNRCWLSLQVDGEELTLDL
jgi:hypothetical protein